MTTLNQFSKETHQASVDAGWWPDAVRNNPMVVSNKIALIHSEISEALEGDRKNSMDDHLPHRKMIEVELADALIRIGDLAGFLDLDLDGAIKEKMEYNLRRQDHKKEVRESTGGKAY